MKLALQIVFGVTLISLLLYLLTTGDNQPPQRIETPWQIQVTAPDQVEVMGVKLGQTTLEDLRQRFGNIEGIALFRSPDGRYSLEAYLGKVTIGPLSARWIVMLKASQQEMERLTERSVKRIRTENGSYRWTLKPDAQADQADRVVASLTYIPDYRGMDADYLQSRFGAPQRILTVDENSEQWLYPDKGLRILFDREGKELFEYMSPEQMAAGQSPQAHHREGQTAEE